MTILDYIFPKRCVKCGSIGSYICPMCTKDIFPIVDNEMICPVCEKLAIDGRTHPICQTKSSLDGLISFFHYRGAVRALIKTLKYRGVFDVVQTCLDFIPKDSYALCKTMIGSDAICVPIPLFRLRNMQRGFNQSELLGRYIAQKLHIPIVADILYRTKQTVPQVEMKDRKARLKNMKDVFSIRDNVQSMPHSVILFDDVWTTGATMRAAAFVLKKYGVQHVLAVTFAR